MAKILDCGSISAHDRELGINHKNIAKELTTANWNNKAIVRDGIYMYVLKCKYRENSTSNERVGILESRTFRPSKSITRGWTGIG